MERVDKLKEIFELKELFHKMLEAAMDEVLFKDLPTDIYDIVQGTRALFSERFGHEISEREAMQIYKRVRELVEVLCSDEKKAGEDAINKRV